MYPSLFSSRPFIILVPSVRYFPSFTSVVGGRCSLSAVSVFAVFRTSTGVFVVVCVLVGAVLVAHLGVVPVVRMYAGDTMRSPRYLYCYHEGIQASCCLFEGGVIDVSLYSLRWVRSHQGATMGELVVIQRTKKIDVDLPV